ncbi:hypothetical protein [Lampropedia hyalina]|jgi:hypothetical protein|uniref:hypothetical protein n=1 Tax=Lampropedia hyalina TaxID=198706 RepID=UPI00116153B4|nr:hypothetical protein [Lampropedia hyalina]
MKSPTEILLTASATEKIRQLLKIGLTFLVLIFLFFLLLNPNLPARHDDVLSAHQAEVSSHPFRVGRGRYKTLEFDIGDAD